LDWTQDTADLDLTGFENLSGLPKITIHPDICNGKPTLRGLRITVQTVLEFLSVGESREEILRQYPSLQNDDIDACLAFTGKLI
jgi:uncharacterized protein (DUF433 family)